MDRQNLTLLTDLYELTMMQGYFKHKDRNETVIFPVLVFSMRIFSTIWQISVSRVIFMPFRREQSFSRESLLSR